MKKKGQIALATAGAMLVFVLLEQTGTALFARQALLLPVLVVFCWLPQFTGISNPFDIDCPGTIPATLRTIAFGIIFLVIALPTVTYLRPRRKVFKDIALTVVVFLCAFGLLYALMVLSMSGFTD